MIECICLNTWIALFKNTMKLNVLIKIDANDYSNRIDSNCGSLHFFCQSCTIQGWESNAGKGGSCQLRNKFTKETKEPFWNVDCFY